MDPQLRSRAEARLASAAEALGLADPRPPYRDRLRELRQTHPDAFERAIAHYEQRVLPALAQDDPLPVWLEYGRFLGSLTGQGRLTHIDESGRASTWPPGDPAALMLFVPDDTAAGALVLCQPASPSAAQQATLTLLVERKLSM
jgi:hypothetical protein